MRAAMSRPETLPASLPPRGLSRVQAAAYIGVGVTLFDQLIADGRMPKPKRINARTVWDREQLDRAFAALPNEDGEGGADTWADFS
jgi:predicted DNA-binding transcriptional regulator AlpA